MSAERTSAQLCRENGWGKGTVLERVCVWRSGESRLVRLRITAVGEDQVLARRFADKWNGGPWKEIREPEAGGWLDPEFHWRKVEAPEPAAAGEEGDRWAERAKKLSEKLQSLAGQILEVDLRPKAETQTLPLLGDAAGAMRLAAAEIFQSQAELRRFQEQRDLASEEIERLKSVNAKLIEAWPEYHEGLEWISRVVAPSKGMWWGSWTDNEWDKGFDTKAEAVAYAAGLFKLPEEAAPQEGGAA